jgi:hypothetical protein
MVAQTEGLDETVRSIGEPVLSALARISLRSRFACAGALVLGLGVGACSESFSVVDLTPQAPRFELKSLPSIPQRVLGPPALIAPDGTCAGGGGDGEFAGSGIALEMSECDVVQRAGPPDGMDFSTNPRGERTAVFTYTRGERPGIYRFVAGRLKSIERGAEPPPPERPVKKKKARSA